MSVPLPPMGPLLTYRRHRFDALHALLTGHGVGHDRGARGAKPLWPWRLFA
ncbi:hypothetical protein SAMN04488093_12025 [Tropicibacter naphthalenivorans]|uniref:Uncharacterized protein n=1 Tax=Tropicibacter naphthalenivorans TaxID=441103 RepID=A0A0P1H0Q8_9RHOB|nr:hypothetical protein TRN7648_04077 [Tropicibacter naphthalenivorans]SMD09924.1 hypothetical protein SAMN04488093_12025 [Tropicibacter naphthalenivorans]